MPEHRQSTALARALGRVMAHAIPIAPTACRSERSHKGLSGFTWLLGVLLACWLPASVSIAERVEQRMIVVPQAAVATDNPVASRIGREVLEAGGNAADAAVAVGFALGVVNPFASGIGGGGFLLYRDAATGQTHALDFREVAPAASSANMFVQDGEVDRQRALFSGLSVGVPGEVAGWWALHQRFGRLPWADLVAPAIALAEAHPAGELLPLRLTRFERIGEVEALRALFWRNGEPVAAGDRIEQPDLARTLRRIAAEGPSAFYIGSVAQDIVDTTARGGGILTLEDLAGYEAVWREPVTLTYRGYTLHGMGPPSSSGIVLGQVLRYLSHFQIAPLEWNRTITAHLILHGLTHAFADRARYLGDEDFVSIDRGHLLGDARIREMVDTFNAHQRPDFSVYGEAAPPAEDAGTAHFSLVDAEGNAVAATTTINTIFGSLQVTSSTGIFLNNQMNDFSLQPGVANIFGLVGAEANAIAPGKRPLSSMAPLIVERDGTLVGSLGGSGGPRIISGSLLVLVQLLDFDRSVGQAIDAPRVHHQWQPDRVFVEEDADARLAEALEALGWPVQQQGFGNAVQAVWRHPRGWQAASDPRKLGYPDGY